MGDRKVTPTPLREKIGMAWQGHFKMSLANDGRRNPRRMDRPQIITGRGAAGDLILGIVKVCRGPSFKGWTLFVIMLHHQECVDVYHGCLVIDFIIFLVCLIVYDLPNRQYNLSLRVRSTFLCFMPLCIGYSCFHNDPGPVYMLSKNKPSTPDKEHYHMIVTG